MPVFGFYLQPAVGGRILPYEFWRGFAEIENVVAIKIAPFNRYQTLDVVRAVAESGRADEIALYTGNDDNIVLDLLTPFRVRRAHAAHSSAACWATGRSGPRAPWQLLGRRMHARIAGAPRAELADSRSGGNDRRQRRDLRRGQRLPRLHRRASTRCCAGRGCWPDAGASIRTKNSRRGKARRSRASVRTTTICPTMIS